MGTMIPLTAENFEAEVLKPAGPVLVFFRSPWCAPCLVTGRILEELAAETGDWLKITVLDVTAEPAAAEKFAAGSVPYLAVFRGGRMALELPGLVPKAALSEELERLRD